MRDCNQRAGNTPQHVEADCVQLVRELLNPEGFGYSVTEEVRTAARRALRITNNPDFPPREVRHD